MWLLGQFPSFWTCLFQNLTQKLRQKINPIAGSFFGLYSTGLSACMLSCFSCFRSDTTGAILACLLACTVLMLSYTWFLLHDIPLVSANAWRSFNIYWLWAIYSIIHENTCVDMDINFHKSSVVAECMEVSSSSFTREKVTRDIATNRQKRSSTPVVVLQCVIADLYYKSFNVWPLEKLASDFKIIPL